MDPLTRLRKNISFKGTRGRRLDGSRVPRPVKGAAIAGIVVGLVLVSLLVGALIFWLRRRRMHARRVCLERGSRRPSDAKTLLRPPSSVLPAWRRGSNATTANSDGSCGACGSPASFATRYSEIKTVEGVPGSWVYNQPDIIGRMAVAEHFSLASDAAVFRDVQWLRHERRKASTSSNGSGKRSSSGRSVLAPIPVSPQQVHIRQDSPRGTLPYHARQVDSPQPTAAHLPEQSSPRFPLAVASPTTRARTVAAPFASPQRSLSQTLFTKPTPALPVSRNSTDSDEGAEEIMTGLSPYRHARPAKPWLMTRQHSEAASAISLPRTVSHTDSLLFLDPESPRTPETTLTEAQMICRDHRAATTAPASAALLLDLGPLSSSNAPYVPPRSSSVTDIALAAGWSVQAPTPPRCATPTPSSPVSSAPSPKSITSTAARQLRDFKESFHLDLGQGVTPVPMSLMPSPMLEKRDPFATSFFEATVQHNRFTGKSGWL